MGKDILMPGDEKGAASVGGGSGFWDNKDNMNGLMSGLSLLGSISQARGLEAQGNYQNAMAKINSGFAEDAAIDSERRGYSNANKAITEARKLKGSQRAAYAASGVDVNYGSAARVQNETEFQGELDALTIKTNAFRESLGYKMKALDYRTQGEMAKISGDAQARSTLLTGGLKAISTLYGSGY